MVSKRIKLISSLIENNDKVLDIGTDHALLLIYLINNNFVNVADGSDISKKVLKNANENVLKYHLENNINLYYSDGINNIDISKYNTFIIAGMGFSTIKGILENKNIENINKLIIQTNNDYEKARHFLNDISYKIEKELCLKEKGINYIIFLLKKGKQKLSKEEYLCGKFNIDNVWYYKEEKNKLEKIKEKIPEKFKQKRILIDQKIRIYNKYLSKERIED